MLPPSREPRDPYDHAVVRELFDEMSATYVLTNEVSSFGFNSRWRAACVRGAGVRPGMVVLDLMCGTGDCWRALLPRLGRDAQLVAVDFSPRMCGAARVRAARYPHARVDVREEDALNMSLPDGSVDAVICAFGLKTLAPRDLSALAREVRRVLRPGGTFSFVEISVPSSRLLRVPYLFYLRALIPLIGRVCLGSPDNYRQLSRYTTAFGNARTFERALREQGLRVSYRSYFFGCASGVVGNRP